MTMQVQARYDADASGFITGTRQAQDALGALKATSKEAAGGLQTTANAADRAGNETEELGRKTERTDRATAQFGSQLGRLRNLIAGVGVGLLAREVLATGLEFERMSVRFQTAAGGIAAGEAAMETARGTAERFGLDLIAAERGLSGLLAAARGTAIEAQATEIFEGVATAAAALQLPGEQVQGALTAIEQIMSKGTVQAEELRGQLGERLPGAFQIAARSMGVTTAELGDMLQAGEVLAEDFLPKFARQLREEFGQGASDAATGAAADFTRFRNALIETQRAFSSSGFLAGVTDGMVALTEVLKDPGTQAALESFGRTLGEGLSFAAENAGDLATAIGGLAGLRFAALAIGWGRAARQAAGGIGLLSAAMRGVSLPFTVLSLAAAGLPFLFDSSSEKLSNLRDTSRTAADSLRDYAEASKKAAQEQDGMAGKVSEATEELMRQSRARAQDALTAARAALTPVLNDVRGGGLLSVRDDLTEAALKAAAVAGNQELVDAIWDSGGADAAPLGAVFGDLAAMLTEVQRGNETVLPQLVAELDRVAGAGEHVSRAARDVETSLANFGTVDPEAEARLLRLADAVGGLEEQIAAITSAQTDAGRTEALAALAEQMDRLAEAGKVLRDTDGAGPDLRDRLRAALDFVKTAEDANAILDGTADLTEDVADSAGEIDFTGAARTAGALAGQLERATRALDGLRQGQSGLEAANAGLRARLEALRGGAAPDAARLEGQLAEERASIGPLANIGSGPDDGSRGAEAALDVLRQRGNVLRENLELERLIADLENEGRGGGGAGRSFDLTQELVGEFGERFGATFEQSSRKIEEWRTRTIAALEEAGLAHSGMADMVDQIARDRLAEAYRADLENRTDWKAGVERALADIAEAHGSMADIAEDFVNTGFQAMEDAFVSLARTGKIETEDLVEFVLRQFWRMGMAMASGQFQTGGSGGGWLGNIIGSIFGFGGGTGATVTASVNHAGGYPGPGAPQRTVSASAFVGAPRLHTGGLLPGERPAILEENERVLTVAQQEATAATIRGLASLAALPSGSASTSTAMSPVINLNIIGASSEPEVQRRQTDNGFDIDVIFGEIEGRLSRNTAEGRGLAPAIAGRFNLRQGGL